MAFCLKCGAAMLDTDKFCTACGANANSALKKSATGYGSGNNAAAQSAAASAGASTAAVAASVGASAAAVATEAADSSTRVQEYAGKITKCPSCGEVLKALTVKCPACGFELREVNNASSVKDFTDKLANTISVKEKIELIRNYPIPNAKEDIFEFLVLATSNFDTKKYAAAYGSDKQISEAWLTKIEQAYVKAESLFKNDKDFDKFQEIYDSDIKELHSHEESQKNRKHYVCGTIMLVFSAILTLMVIFIGSGFAANPRIDAVIIAGFVNGILSYLYAGNKKLKLPTLVVYIANVVMNVAFCFVAPGHIINAFIVAICGLCAFIEKK